MSFRSQLAAVTCLSLLLPICSLNVRGQNKSQITIEVGQPNIWSLGQAHYLLANMRERSRDLGVKVPLPSELNPSSATATRMSMLRTLVGADVGLDTVAGGQNSILNQRFEADLSRFNASQSRLDALTAPYTDAVRETSSLTIQLAALPADRPELAEQRKLVVAQLAAKTAERDALKAEMDLLRAAVTAPGAPTAYKGSIPTATPATLPDDVKTMFDKLNTTVATPQLNASTTLENYIQMQYEVIAKQLTLLRDEVGPNQRLVFLEMPMSLYSVPKADDDYVVRLEWQVARFFGSSFSGCPKATAPEKTGAHYGQSGFRGEPINLNVVNASLRDVLDYIHEQYGPVFVVDRAVGSIQITARVSDKPWNVVLDAILKRKQLSAEVYDNKIYVTSKKDEETQAEPITLDMLRENNDGGLKILDEDPVSAETLKDECWGNADPTKFRVIDIIPRQSALNINDQHGTQKGLALTARFLTMFGLGGTVSFQRQRSLYEQFIQQEVYASAYGKGMSNFGWTFGPLPGTKRLAPGVRTTYAILAIPNDALALELKVAAKVYKRDVSPGDTTVKEVAQVNEGYGAGTYRMLVPNERTEGFWVDRVTYTPVEKGKQATVIIDGKYFSPLTGILVNGVPLKRAVSIAKNESSIANTFTGAAVDPAGEFEYLSPQQLILSFKMPQEYVGTPLITLVTPEKTSAINFFKLENINFHYRNMSLSEISEVEPMFADTFALASIEVVDDSDPQFVTVHLQGAGLRRGARFFIGPQPLDTANGEEATHLSPGLYRVKFRRPAEGRAVKIRYRNTSRQAVQEGYVNFQQTVISNYEIIRYDPAAGGRLPVIDLIVTVSGQDVPPVVRIEARDGSIIDAPTSLGNHRYRIRIAARRDPVPLTVAGANGVTRIFDIGIPAAPSISSVVNATTNKPEGLGTKTAVVTLRGINFRHVVRVLFGGKEATIMQVDPEVILVSAPTGEEGPVQILLETNIALRGRLVSNIADFRTPGKAIYSYPK